MSLSIPGAVTYTFTPSSGSAATFPRLVSGEFDDWFALEVGYVKDSILDGRTVVDVGSYQYPPLVLVAAFATAAERTALKSLVAIPGTLTNSLSRAAEVVLVRAREPAGRTPFYLLECTFEKYD
jgi:hypothetical protein